MIRTWTALCEPFAEVVLRPAVSAAALQFASVKPPCGEGAPGAVVRASNLAVHPGFLEAARHLKTTAWDAEIRRLRVVTQFAEWHDVAPPGGAGALLPVHRTTPLRTPPPPFFLFVLPAGGAEGGGSRPDAPDTSFSAVVTVSSGGAPHASASASPGSAPDATRHDMASLFPPPEAAEGGGTGQDPERFILSATQALAVWGGGSGSTVAVALDAAPAPHVVCVALGLEAAVSGSTRCSPRGIPPELLRAYPAAQLRYAYPLPCAPFRPPCGVPAAGITAADAGGQASAKPDVVAATPRRSGAPPPGKSPLRALVARRESWVAWRGDGATPLPVTVLQGTRGGGRCSGVEWRARSLVGECVYHMRMGRGALDGALGVSLAALEVLLRAALGTPPRGGGMGVPHGGGVAAAQLACLVDAVRPLLQALVEEPVFDSHLSRFYTAAPQRIRPGGVAGSWHPVYTSLASLLRVAGGDVRPSREGHEGARDSTSTVAPISPGLSRVFQAL